MKIRPLDSSDQPRVEDIFRAQGIAYDFPDCRTMVSALAVEDGRGQVAMALLARPTIELYLLMDGQWKTPAWRLEAFKKLHEAMRRDLVGKGFEDVHVWIPPEKKSFVRRLMRDFGWTRPEWTDLTRSLEPIRG